MSARTLARIAINLGGGLRAEEAARAGGKFERELDFVARQQAAAEAAGVGPHALAARTGNEEFQRTGRPRRSDGALTGDQREFETAMTGGDRRGAFCRELVHARIPQSNTAEAIATTPAYCRTRRGVCCRMNHAAPRKSKPLPASVAR